MERKILFSLLCCVFYLHQLTAQTGTMSGTGMSICNVYSFSICPSQTITPFNYGSQNYACNNTTQPDIAFNILGSSWRVQKFGWSFSATTGGQVSGYTSAGVFQSFPFSAGNTITPLSYSGTLVQIAVNGVSTGAMMDQATYSISLNSVAFGGNTYTYCASTTPSIAITPTVPATGGPWTYHWQPGNITGNPAHVSPTASTVYTVSATTGNGCASTATVAVNVNCMPQPLCSGTSGAPVFLEDFGSGAALYGPALAPGITNYMYQTGAPPNGSYVISYSSNPSGVNAGYVADHDHTGNPNGYMMVVNSDYPASEVYRKHVTGLCPNTTYVFSSYLSNNNTPSTPTTVCPGYVYANVKFQIEYPVSVIQNSVTTGNLPLGLSNTALNWQQYGFAFTTVAGQTSVDVVLKNNAPGGCGNDYVVDDISLSPCGPGLALSLPQNQTTFCPGDYLVLQSAYTSGSYVNPQYQWQFSSNGGVTWADVPGATSSNYTITSLAASQAGLYQLLASENGNITSPGCRIAAGPLTVGLSGISVNSATICSSATATLTATGASSYTWSTGATGSSITVSPSSTTSYTVTGGSGACTQAVSTVSVIPSSTLSVTGNTLICQGQTTTLTATGATTYSWNTGATSPSVSVSPTSTTNYTVSNNTGLCSQPSVITVSVNIPPAVAVTGNSVICAGQASTLTASGATSYSWSTGSTLSSITVSPASSTSYSLTGTLGACTVQVVKSVVVNPIPVVSVTGNSLVCSGQSATFTASGASTYTWSTGAVSPSLTVSPPVTTSYTVLGSAAGCTAQALATLSVIPSPVVSITGNTVVCSGQSTSLTASGANTYAWSTGSASAGITVSPFLPTTYTVVGTTGACTAQAVVTVTTSAVFITGGNTVMCAGKTVTLSADGANTYTWSTGAGSAAISVSPSVTTTYSVATTTGSCTSQAAVTVSVVPGPTLAVTGNTLICSGQSTILSAGGANNYKWNTGQAYPVVTVSPTVTTTYSVTGAIASCSDVAVYTVSVDPSPVAFYTVSPNPTDILTPLVVFINGSYNYTTWAWDFGDGSAPDSVEVNPAHSYDSDVADIYHTSLMLSNQFGCTSTAYLNVVVNPAFVFYIPNAFTPNNHDGLNDVFTGQGIGIAEYSMWIYDRWGACIFSSDDISKGWDGRQHGKSELVQNDVYTWKVEIKDVLQKTHQYFGSVTVLK